MGTAAEEVAGAVVQEAIDEVRGTSNKKWGVAVVAFAIGMIVAVIVIRRRVDRLEIEESETLTA